MAVTWKALAYAADVASLSDSSPVSVGTAVAAGSGASASRYDHVHDLGADCIDSGDLVADDVIGSEHIEQLSAALDFGGQQATDMVLDNQASNPSTPVVGKIYYNTGDSNAYICTSAA